MSLKIHHQGKRIKKEQLDMILMDHDLVLEYHDVMVHGAR
jgi:hypothetical protein